MMRLAFPQALYVGMDTSPMLAAGGRHGAKGEISDRALQGILDTNSRPTLHMHGAFLKANCWDMDLIRDIMRKTGRNVPIFVEKDAFNALMDGKMNLWERKHDYSQRLSYGDFVSFSTPFMAQIHIPKDSRLKVASEQAGWITDVFDIGLLLLRTDGTTFPSLQE